MRDRSLPDMFARWAWMRAVLHRGWWLVTSVYLVVDAGLSAFQLVLIGVAQALTALVFEVPAGVIADTLSRKWSLVLSHMLMGTAMFLTGMVTAFLALVATQMLWGLAWTFSSGADVAWVTDELNEPEVIAPVLARSARYELVGSAVGLISIGLLAWATQRSTAIVLAGTAMLLLGLYVALRFPETRFEAVHAERWRAAGSIFGQGLSLVRRSKELLLLFAATFLVSGAAGVFGRLYPKQLLDQGVPTADPMLWLTGLGVLTFLTGAAAVRTTETRIGVISVARRGYVVATAAGATGTLVLAMSSSAVVGSAAVLLGRGVAMPLTRTIGTIWVNQRTSGHVRATVHSLLAQAEYLGVITCGLAIGLLAQATTLPVAMVGCAVLFTVTAVLISRSPRHHAHGGTA